MASGPITSWQIDGKQWKQWQTLFSWAPKSLQMVTATMKLKDFLLLGRKDMTNLDNVLKSRDMTLLTKVRTGKTMVFPVLMYGCECWITKKAECWRIDAFKLWSWRRLLRVPWTARRSNQSIIKDINLEYSLEGLMLKLKLQYFGHLMERANSLEKALMLGKIEGRRRRGWQRMRWLYGITRLNGHEWIWARSGRQWGTGRSGVLQSIGLQSIGHDWMIEQQQQNANREGSQHLFSFCKDCLMMVWGILYFIFFQVVLSFN